MKFLSLAPFVPSSPKYEASKQFFLELGFTLTWDAGAVTPQPYGIEVNIIDIAGVCWHFVE